MSTLTALFGNIADAIRGKTGGSAEIAAEDFPTAIGSIEISPVYSANAVVKTGITVDSQTPREISIDAGEGEDFSVFNAACVLLAPTLQTSSTSDAPPIAYAMFEPNPNSPPNSIAYFALADQPIWRRDDGTATATYKPGNVTLDISVGATGESTFQVEKEYWVILFKVGNA